MARDIVFDLTEMLLASTGKLRYYGIVRVVAEIATELAKRNANVRFCVYSAGHGRFFETRPERTADGTIHFPIPEGVRQIRVRSVFHQRKPLRDAFAKPIRAIANGLNRRAWCKAGADLPEIKLDGATFVSCGRPKLMVDQLHACDRLGWDVDFVPLLHDMIPLHDHFTHRGNDFPSNFVNDNILLLKRAALILTNSQFTKDELLSFAGTGYLPPVPEEKIWVVPLVHECPQGTEPAQQTPPNDPYILTVGATLGRKNLEAVFQAVRHMRAEGLPAPRIVVAGAKRLRTEKRLAEEDMAEIRDLVDFYYSPNQTDLVALYRGAVALVLASRMEGWGLPAGEALWLGTPAICATSPALREVAGDLGLYFDPDRPEELTDHIARLTSDATYARAIRERIAAARTSLRTWADVAEDVERITIASLQELEKPQQGIERIARTRSNDADSYVFDPTA